MRNSLFLLALSALANACGMPEATTAAATGAAAKAAEAKAARQTIDQASNRAEQALQQGAAQRDAAIARER